MISITTNYLQNTQKKIKIKFYYHKKQDFKNIQKKKNLFKKCSFDL